MNQPHTPPHVHLDDQPIKAFWCWTKKSKERQPLQLYSWTVNLEWLVQTQKHSRKVCDFPETVKVSTSRVSQASE